jgi:hypothetical protein
MLIVPNLAAMIWPAPSSIAVCMECYPMQRYLRGRCTDSSQSFTTSLLSAGSPCIISLISTATQIAKALMTSLLGSKVAALLFTR